MPYMYALFAPKSQECSGTENDPLNCAFYVIPLMRLRKRIPGFGM
jgi:hypothetical protein